MNGPTIRERADGSARRTCRPPRSTERGTITWVIASLERASPKAGSLAGKKLIGAAPDLKSSRHGQVRRPVRPRNGDPGCFRKQGGKSELFSQSAVFCPSPAAG